MITTLPSLQHISYYLNTYRDTNNIYLYVATISFCKRNPISLQYTGVYCDDASAHMMAQIR